MLTTFPRCPDCAFRHASEKLLAAGRLREAAAVTAALIGRIG